MTPLPEWLPELVKTDGEWDEILDRLYSVFESDFKNGKPFFKGIPVWWDRRILSGEKYEEGFWHLITKEDRETGERLFDPRRAERLSWFVPMLEKCSDKEIKVWDYREGKRRLRTYVWLERYDYALILERKQMKNCEVAIIVTAFYVRGDSKRRDLRKRFSKRES